LSKMSYVVCFVAFYLIRAFLCNIRSSLGTLGTAVRRHSLSTPFATRDFVTFVMLADLGVAIHHVIDDRHIQPGSLQFATSMSSERNNVRVERWRKPIRSQFPQLKIINVQSFSTARDQA
jgi:hypothetical protein